MGGGGDIISNYLPSPASCKLITPTKAVDFPGALKRKYRWRKPCLIKTSRYALPNINIGPYSSSIPPSSFLIKGRLKVISFRSPSFYIKLHGDLSVSMATKKNDRAVGIKEITLISHNLRCMFQMELTWRKCRKGKSSQCAETRKILKVNLFVSLFCYSSTPKLITGFGRLGKKI